MKYRWEALGNYNGVLVIFEIEDWWLGKEIVWFVWIAVITILSDKILIYFDGVEDEGGYGSVRPNLKGVVWL